MATLAYYDVLDLPLKTEEIFARLINFRHLASHQPPAISYQLIDLESTKKELDQLILDQNISRTGEYYFLFDREYLAPLRLKREKIAKHKWRKAKRAIWWLRFLPYIEAVFASGSLAINNTDELSDLDVLVVVKYGRIWLARLLIIVVLSILGVRRRGLDKIAPDKICLNHYISDRSLAVPFKSIYNAQTYSNLVSIYARNTELIHEFKKENTWVLDFIFNWNVSDKPIIKSGLPEIIVKLIEAVLNTKLGNIFEKWAKHLQYQRIACNPLTQQSGGRVIFNDEQLEFHPHSIETSIIKKYNTNLIKLGMSDLAIEQDSGLVK